MTRIIGRIDNSTLEYICDCGMDVQVEHIPFQRGSGVLETSVQHCPGGQRQKVHGKPVALREKRDDEWIAIALRQD